MEFKDYYKILGVPRTAGEDEIKKSFRKLAREYHPDVAKDKKRAEEKFKEINEAYEVLGDPAKRKKYDELGAGWKQGAEFRPPPGWQQAPGGRRRRSAGGEGAAFEFEFGGTGFSDFFESLFGGRGGGFGRGDFGRDYANEGQDFTARGQDIEADLMVPLDEAAHGVVRSISLRMTNERGETRTQTYKVRVPAGVREGQRLRLAGRGEAGIGGGEAGDLYLTVRYAKHPEFTFEGGNLYCEVQVAPWEAVLGAHVNVPTLKGSVNIKIPPGTQAGQKLRIRGRGFPHANGEPGDLFVEVRVAVPGKVSDPERELWEKLARESRFNPRAD